MKIGQMTLISLVAVVLMSGCGSDSSSSTIPTIEIPSTSIKVYTADEMLNRAFLGAEYLSTFEHTVYLDGSKAGTAVDTTFPCDSGSADVRIVYLDAESSVLALTDFNNCQLGDLVLTADTSVASITINTAAGSSYARNLLYSIEPETGIQHQMNVAYNHNDGSYRGVGSSKKIVGEPLSVSSVLLDIFGSYDMTTDMHSVASGDLVHSESDENGVTTLIYDYTFDYQNNSTLYFASDIAGESNYEYVIP